MEPTFDLLDRALAAKDQWRFFLLDLSTPAEVAARFADLYNELRHRLGRGDRPSLHGAFLGAKTKARRNHPGDWRRTSAEAVISPSMALDSGILPE